MENKLWTLCKTIYDNSDCKEAFVKKCNDYWNGKLHKDMAIFSDQDCTAFNVIEPIVETKLTAMLDTNFSVCVVPRIKSFASLKTIKDQQAVADIYNDELLNVMKNNKMDVKKEIIGRYGMNCGFGFAQTTWDDNIDEIGQIIIDHIPSEKIRFDKDATSIKDSSFIAYDFSISVAKAKDLYGRDDNNQFDEAKCLKIDAISESKYSKKQDSRGAIKGVVNYKTDVVSGQMYSYGDDGGDCDGISAGKVVNLVCMYLEDDSYYAPQKNDNSEEEDFKEEQIAKYPNGRMIIFSLNDKEKVILEDVALPKSFTSLGNMSCFNPKKWNGITGKGEIENLIPTQNRIDGLYNKYRKSLEEDFTVLAVQKNEEIALNDLITHPVFYMKPDDIPPLIVSNGGMEKATEALSMIERLETHASKMARINETMMYGYRQTGTTSGEQVQKLQESPLADIRSITRNFKDFYIDIANKVLELIKNNYTVDRLIKLSTGMTNAEFARLKLNSVSGEKEMELLNEAGEAIKTIKMNDEWDFCVEVSAGTEVPRTRKEQAVLYDTLIDRGILNIQDLDVVEQYLKAQDIPNYRILIKILRDKQEQAQQAQQDPASRNWKEVMKNPEIAKVFADTFKSISGYSLAQQQMLSEVGLVPNPGKLDNTPVTEITSQSDVAQVATIANIVSEDQETAIAGRNAAIAEQLSDLKE